MTPETSSRPRANAGARLVVLVIEDQPELCDVLCHVLTDADVLAVGVRDGAAALEYLEREPTPAALVLDLLLPRVDGWQVLDRLRAEPQLAPVPVIVISAAPRERVAQALAHGPALFLPKPLDAVRLVRSVRRVCGLDPDAAQQRAA
ncbi:MAG: response regulator [Planctomycetes bacterium]|nr:response regulator [Planctomycetota bacterium]